MNKPEFRILLNQMHARLLDLTATKGEEYANDNEDQLANFKRQGAELGLDPKAVLKVFLNKHLDAISFYIRNGSARSEPIEGRILDAILYLALLQALIIDEIPKVDMSCATDGGVRFDEGVNHRIPEADRLDATRPYSREKAEAAARTLERKGYEWRGGVEWAPPIGPGPLSPDERPPVPTGVIPGRHWADGVR